MVNYREILRLDSLNYTQRQIAASVHSSRNTISEVLHLADAKGLHVYDTLNLPKKSVRIP